MAAGNSGSFTADGNKAGITASFSWSEVYDVINNESDYVSLSMKVKSSQYIEAYWLNGTIKVDGETLITFNSELGSHCADILTRNTYYSVLAKGSYTKQPWKTGVIKHDSDGSKSVTVAIDIKAYTMSGKNGSGWTINTSKTIALTNIDRESPIVSFTANSITTNSIAIKATANTKCDIWEYSLNGGTWTRFSNAPENSLSADQTIVGLSLNTSYSVRVRARRTYNRVYGASSAKNIKTLGSAVIHSCGEFMADNSTVKIVPSVTVYDAKFKYYVTLKNGTTKLFTTNALSWSAGKADRTVTLTGDQRTQLLSAMYSDKNKEFVVVVETYDGTELVGTTSSTAVAKTTHANSGPRIDGFTYKDNSHSSVTGDESVLIQGVSELQVVANEATARNEASITHYSVSIANKTVKKTSRTIDVGVVSGSGSLELTVSAIDSRGYSTSVKKTVKVLEYEKPRITQCTVRRADGVGDVIQLSFRGTMSVIKPDGETDVNRLVNVSYRYKETSKPENFNDDGTGYSVSHPIHDQVSRSSDGTVFSFQTNQLMSLDPDFSFDFRTVVKDRVGSSVEYYVIPRGIPLIAVRKSKVGINNPDPKYTVDVNGDINLSGDIYINGVKLSKVLGLE